MRNVVLAGFLAIATLGCRTASSARTGSHAQVRPSGPRLSSVRPCYENALRRQQLASGQILLAWTITKEGGVTGVRAVRDEVGDKGLTECLVAVVGGWKYDSRAEDEVVELPFRFEPG
jgi:hypothetical protein